MYFYIEFKKSQMGKLKYLVIHCTDTPEGRQVSRKDIEQWHLVENGWSRVGYSDMIHIDGSLENLIEFDQDETVDPWEISNGASGFNSVSRHVVYVGGAQNHKPKSLSHYPMKDTRNFQQLETMDLYVKFMIKRHPDIIVCGHNQLSNKGCPSFDVPKYLRSICVAEKNIF